MSMEGFSGPLLQQAQAGELFFAFSAADRRVFSTRSAEQHAERKRYGHTLLKLAHAAEYLEERRRFVYGAETDDAEDEAIHILMRSSRDVFREYAEDAPWVQPDGEVIYV